MLACKQNPSGIWGEKKRRVPSAAELAVAESRGGDREGELSRDAAAPWADSPPSLPLYTGHHFFPFAVAFGACFGGELDCAAFCSEAALPDLLAVAEAGLLAGATALLLASGRSFPLLAGLADFFPDADFLPAPFSLFSLSAAVAGAAANGASAAVSCRSCSMRLLISCSMAASTVAAHTSDAAC